MVFRVMLGKAFRQDLHFCLRLLDRNSLLQAPELYEVHLLFGRLALRSWCRHPNIWSERLESPRHHTHDGGELVIQSDCSADDGEVTTELAPPDVVAQDGDGWRSGIG